MEFIISKEIVYKFFLFLRSETYLFLDGERKCVEDKTAETTAS